MVKKIGCVIAYAKNHNNYGTSLQGYAMLKKIQDLGYDCEVIRYKKHLSFFDKVKLEFVKLRLSGFKASRLQKEVKNKKEHPDYAANIAVRTKVVDRYKATHLEPLFKEYDGYETLHKGSLNYDAVVIGSDQVWLPMSLYGKYYNLLFVDDSVKKISYASSFGVSMIPSFQQKATGAYLDRFSSIGVREVKGKEIVESLSYQKAQVVADPTLLLDRNEWAEETQNSKVNVSDPYIFCYFLGNNLEARRAANELKAKTGLKIVTIRHMDEFVPNDETFGDEAPYNIDPEDFVRYISKADYVCTDSFHCSAFSIQFQKKFMTFYRFSVGAKGGRNSRIDSLFNVLGVSRDHIYQGDISKIDSPIDWQIVDMKLGELRNLSIDFIKEALR